MFATKIHNMVNWIKKNIFEHTFVFRLSVCYFLINSYILLTSKDNNFKLGTCITSNKNHFGMEYNISAWYHFKMVVIILQS